VGDAGRAAELGDVNDVAGALCLLEVVERGRRRRCLGRRRTVT
jgi:hypothetical protein